MIKTTQGDAVTAYKAITALRQRVRGKEALALHHLKRVLQENMDFQAEEEERLIAEYGATVIPGGMVTIEDAEKRMAFQVAHKALQDTECEVDAEPVTISIESNPDITLEEIEQLEPFVTFE